MMSLCNLLSNQQKHLNDKNKQDKFDKFISPDEGLFERNM